MSKRMRGGDDDDDDDVLVLRETVDGPGLDYLLVNKDTVMVKEERTKFSSYASQVLSGGNSRQVTYAKVASHGRGRIYADGALSMQGFSRGIRAKLAGSLYHDIDIDNCHPILLMHVCQTHGWNAPHLKNYIDNRERVLTCSPGVSRSDAKTAMLTVMYGGSPKHQIRGVDGFKAEMNTLADRVSVAYPDMPVSNEKNPKFSRMSLLLQDMEHDLLMEIARFFRCHGYEIGVYIYDGLMVYRKDVDQQLLDVRLLRECEAQLSLKVTLSEKPLS